MRARCSFPAITRTRLNRASRAPPSDGQPQGRESAIRGGADRGRESRLFSRQSVSGRGRGPITTYLDVCVNRRPRSIKAGWRRTSLTASASSSGKWRRPTLSRLTAGLPNTLLCETADDIVQNLPGVDKAGLDVARHALPVLPDKRFRRWLLRRAQQDLSNPETHHELLELMHACLSLGFEGQYRGVAAQRQSLRARAPGRL